MKAIPPKFRNNNALEGYANIKCVKNHLSSIKGMQKGWKPMTLLEEEKIEETIKGIPKSSFTVLDFIDVFKELYLQVWKRLVGDSFQ